MLFRSATNNDIPAIIALLKCSLGESSTPKSDFNWNWKHNNNPFGNSPVLVADENNQIIGVRSMMKWHWQKGDKIFKALRAVDTATHPDFQGKGIFSKLTLQMIDESTSNNVDFIFNTPNAQSKPGYLKMSWIEAGKLHIGLQCRFPSFFTYSNKLSTISYDTNLSQLCTHWNNQLKKKNLFFTPKSIDYLNWRYRNNPVVDYLIHCEHDIYIAAYLRPRKYFTELRIAELIYQGDSTTIKQKVNQFINSHQSTSRITLISFSPLVKNTIPGLKIVLPVGPVLTLRNLNMSIPFESLSNWNIALGDLELF